MGSGVHGHVSEHFPDTITDIGLLVSIMIPMHPRRSLSCEPLVFHPLHFSSLLDTLHHPRQNCYVVLVTRHVLFTRFVLSMFLVTNTLVTVSGQTMTNIIISRGPRVYLSIAGVVISILDISRASQHFPERMRSTFIIAQL
jgi:hypothetical protein